MGPRWMGPRGGWGPWPWLGLGAGIVAGAIIADQAYRPHPGHYYDEGPYAGPYYYPANYHGDPREICLPEFSHLRMAHWSLHDILRREAALSISESRGTAVLTGRCIDLG